eukprot:Gregarina_sp_Pseudo_9__155@NODE_1104_length_1874_cov_33_728065_g1032_i0_p2_GENE_NODE_1104_length_1874_cov_33_728065_g1032_i0NODE_1104_length_1874_cov_33_728065_g1032_i0_p2_ORF_typecomplete_len241_score43_29_NODE_1104_length_1874_cov_33_728065_g1032_i010881810
MWIVVLVFHFGLQIALSMELGLFNWIIKYPELCPEECQQDSVLMYTEMIGCLNVSTASCTGTVGIGPQGVEQTVCYTGITDENQRIAFVNQLVRVAENVSAAGLQFREAYYGDLWLTFEEPVDLGDCQFYITPLDSEPHQVESCGLAGFTTQTKLIADIFVDKSSVFIPGSYVAQQKGRWIGISTTLPPTRCGGSVLDIGWNIQQVAEWHGKWRDHHNAASGPPEGLWFFLLFILLAGPG